MKKCCIFAAGEYDFTPAPPAGALVIAADAGLSHCASPDFVIGDFDSLGAVPGGDNIIRLPVEKDVTDTWAAVQLALSKKCDDFYIYGALGGRIDHSLANLALAAFISRQNAAVHIFGGGYEISAVTDGSVRIKGEPGCTLSVFSWSEKSEGVTLHGLKYPLCGAVLENTFPLGVSNSFVDCEAEISVKHGTLLIMAQRRRP